jgi:molybdopterin-synthase adenylyltransferase
MSSDTISPPSVAGSSVAVVGVGALGCLLAQALVRGGAAEVVLIDHDAVEEHNLGTQVLYDAGSIDEPKALAAEAQLGKLKLPTRLRPEVTCFMERNAEKLLRGVDHVFCAVDNVASRRIINRACLRLGIPWTYGASEGQRGEAMLLAPRASPCYECMLPRVADLELLECRGHGRILLPSLMSVASWCLALAFSRAEAAGRRYMFDLGGLSLTSFAMPRDPDCRVCGPAATPPAIVSEDCVYNFCGNVTQIIPKRDLLVNLNDIHASPPIKVERVTEQFAYLRMEGAGYDVMRFWKDGRLYISPRLRDEDKQPLERWWKGQTGEGK